MHNEAHSVGSVSCGSVATALSADCAATLQPVSWWDMDASLPPSPTDAFSDQFITYVRAVAHNMETDEAAVIFCLLVIASATIPNNVFIEARPGWRESAVIWAAILAGVGRMKTPFINKVKEPLAEYDLLLNEQFQREKEQAARAIMNDVSTTKPQCDQIIGTDTTIEALVDILQIRPTLLLYVDELAAFFNSMGAYKFGKSADRQHWLSIWSSTTIKVNRRSRREPLTVPNPRISIIGGVQPKVARKLYDELDDGLIDRFFFMVMARKRRVYDVIAVPEETEKAWRDWMFDMLADDGASGDKRARPMTFRLTKDAQRIFGTWYEANDPESAPQHLQGFAGKLCGYCLRIALVLVHLHHGRRAADNPVIDAKLIADAIRVTEWLAAHTARVRSGLTSGISKRARAVLNWVNRKGGMATASDVVTYKVNRIVNADEARSTFTELCQAGMGEMQIESTIAGNKRETFHVINSGAKPA